MNATELRDAQSTFARAAKAAETLRRKRDAAVVLALFEGWSHAQIAEATGLTRGRVGQIAQRK